MCQQIHIFAPTHIWFCVQLLKIQQSSFAWQVQKAERNTAVYK